MFIKRIIDFIFPPNYTCICCGRDIFNNPYGVCEGCKSSLPFLTGRLCQHCSDILISDGDYCKRCKGKAQLYDKAISPFIYTDAIAKHIQNLKYNNAKYLAEPLSRFMADTFCNSKISTDFVTPVPLCTKRMKERGYNQSSLLADSFSKIVNIPVLDVLERVKETGTQTELNFIERQKNLKDAFRVVNKKLVKDKSVLVIDDVFTTGATVSECAKVLKKSGAKVVYVLTAAHTIIAKNNKK